MHIYLLEMPRSGNKPSSLYVGQSKFTPEKSANYYGSGNFCKKYRKKHNMQWIKENVKKTILLRDLPSQEALDYWETFAIADYKDRFGDRVVNRAKGGIGRSGPHKEETKKKIGEANAKVWESDERRAKLSELIKEKWKSDEFRAKHRKIMEEKWKSDEFKTTMSKARKKMLKCDKFRAKMEKIYKSPEYKAKISNVTRGENNPNYDINSVVQIHKRAYEAGDIKVTRAHFNKVLNSPEHKRHTEFMEVFNRYKVEVE